MDDVAQAAMTSAIASLVMTAIGLVVQLGFLVVALTVVRKASAAAGSLLAMAAALGMLGSIGRVVIPPLVSFLTMSAGDASSTLRAHTVTSFVLGLVGLGGAGAQLVGIVWLAQGRRAPREG
jgi:hypothetical protein